MNQDQSEVAEEESQQPADEVEETEAVGPSRSLQAVPADGAPPAESAPVEFSWQASEYVQHHKNMLWYLGLAGVVVVLSAASYLLKSYLSIALFVVIGITVVVYAKRPPRLLTYELSNDGLRIDEKLYPHSAFRSFSVIRDVAWHSIDLEPTQRFMPRLSILFNDDDFDPIVSHLSDRLPRVDREPDFVERVTRFLRF